MTRLTRPAVNAAAKTNPTIIVAEVNSLYQPGPSEIFRRRLPVPSQSGSPALAVGVSVREARPVDWRKGT